MIVVTVGTNEARFDRLLHAVDDFPRDEVIVVQRGHSDVRPDVDRCVDFLPFDELAKLVGEARVVVTHAGVGSIMVALSQGRRPIVVPRLSRFGEAVDDHQLPFARRLADRGLVALVEDESKLAAAVARREQDGVGLESARRSALADDLAAYLRLLVGSDGGSRHSR